MNPGFDEEFLIFRYRKMIEEYGDGVGHHNSSGLDIIAKFAYDSGYRQF